LHFSLSDFRILGRTFKTKLKYTSGVTCSQWYTTMCAFDIFFA
jgi:hypothetical protein